MRNLTRTKTLCLFMSAILLVGTFTACTGQQPSNVSQAQSSQSEAEAADTSSEKLESDDDTGENTRATISEQLTKAESQYRQSPEDPITALYYAKILFKLGSFDEAKTVLNPLLELEAPLSEAVYLAAQLEYLQGRYAKAEELYHYLVENHYDDFGSMAEYGLQMVYYQTNEYSKTHELFTGQEYEDPMLDMMKAFADDIPYQLDWNGAEETTIPFLVTDPMPVIPIEINGVKLNAFIDTGGNSLVLDDTLTTALHVQTLAKDVGVGAGGSTDIMWAKTDTLKLGDVEIKNVPTMLTSSSLFSGGYEKEGQLITFNAVIGTNILQQFIPILDYSSGYLKLIPRSEAGHQRLNEIMANENVVKEVPFVLSNSHYMYARGFVNGRTGLNMFVDTGLDREKEGIAISKDTMNLLKIPMPTLETVKGEGTLGTEDYKVGYFNLDNYGLSSLQSKSHASVYMTSVSDLLSTMIDWNGFICDALISHVYVRQYKWILDFDTMTMIFCE